MIATEMKAFRARHSITIREAGARLGMTGEAFRLRERDGRFTGSELALLAAWKGETVQAAFPSYRLSDGESALVRQFGHAA